MNSKGKYIGLNQRIPFDVLDSAVSDFLEKDVIDREFIFQRMQEYTSGINRAKKATSYVFQILSRQKQLLEKLKVNNTGSTYNSLKIEERKALILCLICLTYPITYDLLIALAQGFKVQSQINKKFITEKVMSIYGSNRTVDIAIDALLPMIIELNAIKREKVSIYSLGSKLTIVNKSIFEIVVFTYIKLSGSKSILIDDINYKPWFLYFDLSNMTPYVFSIFLHQKESTVGKGYLSIKSK